MSFWQTFFAVLIPIAHVAGLLHAGHALLRVRTSQGTIAWVVSLCAFPYVAIPLYWILGRNRFRGYVVARRANEASLAERISRGRKELGKAYASERGPGHPLMRALERLGGLPLTGGNRVELLINGEIVFERMFEAIGAAREYILVEFFIVRSDKVGRRFQELLKERARAGVRVHFIYDEVGSHQLAKPHLREMREAGIEVRAFGSTRGRGNRFQINFRNHRKIVVVDGQTGFVGGLNIGDEYASKTGRFGAWRDTHLRLEGPSVLCAQFVFLEDWHWASEGKIAEVSWDSERGGKDEDGGKRVLILPTGPADPLDTCHLMFVSAIEQARERLWLASPYFVPDEAVIAALQSAALRGVDVRILLPENPDHWIVYLSSFSYYKEMNRVGVRLFRYRTGFMHQKVILIDSDLAAVGTANLDNRSFRLNFEITAFVDDSGFAGEVAEMLEEDFSQAREVTVGEYRQRRWWFRAAVRVARLFAPVQ